MLNITWFELSTIFSHPTSQREKHVDEFNTLLFESKTITLFANEKLFYKPVYSVNCYEDKRQNNKHNYVIWVIDKNTNIKKRKEISSMEIKILMSKFKNTNVQQYYGNLKTNWNKIRNNNWMFKCFLPIYKAFSLKITLIGNENKLMAKY